MQINLSEEDIFFISEHNFKCIGGKIEKKAESVVCSVDFCNTVHKDRAFMFLFLVLLSLANDKIIIKIKKQDTQLFQDLNKYNFIYVSPGQSEHHYFRMSVSENKNITENIIKNGNLTKNIEITLSCLIYTLIAEHEWTDLRIINFKNHLFICGSNASLGLIYNVLEESVSFSSFAILETLKKIKTG